MANSIELSSIAEKIVQYEAITIHEGWGAVKIWGAVGAVDVDNFRTTVKVKDLSKIGGVLVQMVRN